MRVIIIGAGICGLSTAFALDRVGIDATVLEKGPELTPEGAAITLWNNGLQALARLGLKTDFRSIFEPIDALQLITFTGRRLGVVPVSRLNNELGPGAAMVFRPELTALLAENLRPGQLHFGAELAGIEERPDGITAVLADGRRLDGDLLIGADGIRSTTRSLFVPADLVYCGHTAWRGTTQFDHPFFPAGHSYSIIGRGAYIVAHHLTRGRFYWIGTRAARQPIPLERGRRKAEAQNWFKDWLEPMRALIDATPGDAVLVNDIYSSRVADFLVRERSILLGDAAHASAPQLGQGGSMALEDAVIFADCLAREPWPVAARTFVRRRRERTQRVMQASQSVADAYHVQAPLRVWLRNTGLRLAPAAMRLRRAGWAARITLPTLSR